MRKATKKKTGDRQHLIVLPLTDEELMLFSDMAPEAFVTKHGERICFDIMKKLNTAVKDVIQTQSKMKKQEKEPVTKKGRKWKNG